MLRLFVDRELPHDERVHSLCSDRKSALLERAKGQTISTTCTYAMSPVVASESCEEDQSLQLSPC
ncbi:hypothetical protein CSB45_05370 [candidate division KSB3 bacterium]|uniref:Uncharacterized protein n=1 Tax=candidate division KSB3 bacterium TaxID=2044937 RepID=A0A2G6E868_9BACT|nr:MAG: hypothetical protein CSB45_05370 [candidate division KSB3 bacterium]PIE30477.1 MAG: hypothetical protein CSA57_04135 [candidate division KSB3 bacterium]